jgi:GcrA cell cycle regulator
MRDAWPEEHVAALREFISAGSFQEIATMINQRFGTNYSRNAVLGKANRLELKSAHAREKSGKRPKQEKRRRPKQEKRRDIRPRTAPVEAPAPIVPLGIGLLDLNDCDCHYPLGDRPYTYCGHPRVWGKSYCAEHLQVMKRDRA